MKDFAAGIDLYDADINELTDRAAMGLPNHFVPPTAARLPFASLLSDDDERLLECLAGSPDLVQRLAAGIALALAGDPRLPVVPDMSDLPEGGFSMGTDPAQVDQLLEDSARFGVRRTWIEKECPDHERVVHAFRIGTFPVTNVQYEFFLDETGHQEMPTSWTYGRYSPAEANHPVYTVTAQAADAYAAWLSQRTGRDFRLPTEVEWEYAAAGPRAMRYPWGDEWDAGRANTLEAGLIMASPVGAFPGGRSWCGAYDMAGNVEEYVSTTYDPYPGGELVEDDLFLRMGHYRIARGGAFNRFRDLARNQRRHGPYPRSLYAMGFRVAEDVPADDAAEKRRSTS